MLYHFFDGLKHNSSISELEISFCYHNILSADIGGAQPGQVGQEILRVYQEKNNSNLTRISVNYLMLIYDMGEIFSLSQV